MKNIILCFDGTCNDEKTHTNVIRFFSNLEGKLLPQEDQYMEQTKCFVDENGSLIQIAHYLPGVATSTNLKLLVGIQASLTARAHVIFKILKGYLFLSEHYQQGDKVFITGFSRGAYSAASLADFVSKMGLLDPTSLKDTTPIECFNRAFLLFENSKRRFIFRLFKKIFSKEKVVNKIKIEGLALWDIVEGLLLNTGLQNLIGLKPDEWIEKKLMYTGSKLAKNVVKAFHALSIDEKRGNFSPIIWDKDPRMLQRLFAGDHGDIGGFSDDSGLSDITYMWIESQLTALGVILSKNPSYTPKPDPLAPATAEWKMVPWKDLQILTRDFSGKDVSVDPSVYKRMGQSVLVNGEREIYNPSNISHFSS